MRQPSDKSQYKKFLKKVNKNIETMKLTPQEYDTLGEMFRSPDQGNHWMGYLLMENLVPSVNMIYLILGLIEFPSAASNGYQEFGGGYTVVPPSTTQQTTIYPYGSSGYSGYFGYDPAKETGLSHKDWDKLREKVSPLIKEIIRDNPWFFDTDITTPSSDLVLKSNVVQFTGKLLSKMLYFYPEDRAFISGRLIKDMIAKKNGFYPDWSPWLLEDFELALKPKHELDEKQPGNTSQSKQDPVSEGSLLRPVPDDAKQAVVREAPDNGSIQEGD
jgi:hypothetical protein